MWLEFQYRPVNRWRLAAVDGEDFYRLGKHFAETEGGADPRSYRRADGEHPWQDLRVMDLSAIPAAGGGGRDAGQP